MTCTSCRQPARRSPRAPTVSTVTPPLVASQVGFPNGVALASTAVATSPDGAWKAVIATVAGQADVLRTHDGVHWQNIYCPNNGCGDIELVAIADSGRCTGRTQQVGVFLWSGCRLLAVHDHLVRAGPDVHDQPA